MRRKAASRQVGTAQQESVVCQPVLKDRAARANVCRAVHPAAWLSRIGTIHCGVAAVAE
jgi:hypothetical protein